MAVAPAAGGQKIAEVVPEGLLSDREGLVLRLTFERDLQGPDIARVLGISENTVRVLKARALGAKGTYSGRAYIYGLGAMGKAGVTTALEVIRKEMDTTMALCGCRNIEDFGTDHLVRTPPATVNDYM